MRRNTQAIAVLGLLFFGMVLVITTASLTTAIRPPIVAVPNECTDDTGCDPGFYCNAGWCHEGEGGGGNDGDEPTCPADCSFDGYCCDGMSCVVGVCEYDEGDVQCPETYECGTYETVECGDCADGFRCVYGIVACEADDPDCTGAQGSWCESDNTCDNPGGVCSSWCSGNLLSWVACGQDGVCSDAVETAECENACVDDGDGAYCIECAEGETWNEVDGVCENPVVECTEDSHCPEYCDGDQVIIQQCRDNECHPWNSVSCDAGCADGVCRTCSDVGWECGTVDGVSCGTCAAGYSCSDGSCVEDPECTEASHCGTDGYVSGEYCSGDDVVRDYRTYSCIANTCSYSDSTQTIETCDGSTPYCSSGSCVECTAASQCGTNGYIGEMYCNGNTVVQVYRTYSCGGNTCSFSDLEQSVEACGGSTPYCSSGSCVECTTASHCGTDGYVGGTYCLDVATIGRDYRTYSCTSNTCSFSDSSQVYDTSPTGEENSMCYDGQHRNACWTIAVGGDFGADNNQNAVHDRNETGICAPQCSYANCQAEGFDTGGSCSVTTPSDGTVDYSTVDGYGCPQGDSYACYCANCPDGSEWDEGAGRCIETNCFDGIDNNRDGNVDFEDYDCHDQNTPPVIEEFSASTTIAWPHEEILFEFVITDQEVPPVYYTLDFGDGNSYSADGWNYIEDAVTHSYTQVAIYTVTLTATDSLGETASENISIEVRCDDTPTGSPAPNPQSCQACQSCFADGMCFGDNAQMVCRDFDGHNRACTEEGGVWDWTDRDKGLEYAALDTTTCEPLMWFANDEHCEAGSFTNATSDRCDTYAGDTSTGYTCGDDPNEFPVNYLQYDGFTDNYVTRWACLYTESLGCWSLNAESEFRRYSEPHGGSGQEVCMLDDGTRVNTDDVNCDGRLPLYDSQCFVNITGQVRVARADGTIQDGHYSEVRTNNVRDGVLSVQANASGHYALESMPFRMDEHGPYLVEALWLEALPGEAYADPDPATTAIVNFLLEERVCEADCTNTLGRCDRECLGMNDCPTWDSLTVGQQAVFNVAHPEGSARGKRAREMVFVDANETHRLVGIACAEEPIWVPAPQARLEGNMDNLVKYTRLVQMRGAPVRLVISSWS